MVSLFKPYMPDELPELDSILHSGSLSYGKWGILFETKLKEYIGVESLLTTNSYSNAISIVLTVLGLNSGDEIITSPMSCMASNMPLASFGLKIKWCDVDPHTGAMSPTYLERIISSNTKAIFHNHYCGYPGYVDEINDIAIRYNIPVIDDCVEAFGSRYKGKTAGSWSKDISILSFQTVRLPNTIDGGAIIFNDKTLYDKAIIARDLGINRKIFRDENNEISPICDIDNIGYAATMSEINSYIGYEQLKHTQHLLESQQRNARKIKLWLEKNITGVEHISSNEETYPNYWVYGLLCNNKLESLNYIRSIGYYASAVHLNNNLYSVFGQSQKLKGVDEFQSKFLAIPSGWWVNNNDYEI